MNVLGVIFSIIMLSFITMIVGVSGIIEHKSPENISSLSLLSSGFITYFKYHALIILGASSLTLSVWFMVGKLEQH